jgi:Arc/MetJ-type ribon-helix-helix transcriptional regulator
MGSGRRPETGSNRSIPVTVRFSEPEARRLEEQQHNRRFVTASAYIRHLVAQDKGESHDEEG